MDNEARRAQLLDDLLGLQAAGLIADEEAAELDRCNALAGEYDRPALDSRLRQMIRRREARDGFRAWAVKIRKPAATVAAFLLIAYCVVMSVEALQVPFLNLFSREQDTHTEYGAAQTVDDLRAAGFLYAPGYVPDGYTLVKAEGGDMLSAIYTNSQGDSIFFEQADSEWNSAQDGETEKREINVNGVAAHLITGKGQTVIFWEQGGVFLKLVCSLEAAEAIRIVESINKL